MVYGSVAFTIKSVSVSVCMCVSLSSSKKKFKKSRSASTAQRETERESGGERECIKYLCVCVAECYFRCVIVLSQFVGIVFCADLK